MDVAMRLADLNRTFVLPPRLGHSRPRDVRLTIAGRALVVCAAVLFAGSLACGILLPRELHRQADRRRTLVTTAVMTTGTVTRVWRPNKNEWRIAYTFVADGRAYSNNRRLSNAQRTKLAVGSTIGVRYAAPDPRINDLGGRLDTGMPVAVAYLIAVGIALGGALCLAVLDRERALLVDGRAAPALVTGHKKSSGSHGSHYSMTYRFALLNGAEMTGKGSASKSGPAIGSAICVIYDPERPARNRVFPFSLVQPG